MPKTWRPLEITNSPTKFGIRIRDDDDPSHPIDVDLPWEYDTEQKAKDAITAWKDGDVKEKEKKERKKP